MPTGDAASEPATSVVVPADVGLVGLLGLKVTFVAVEPVAPIESV
jgi:hypothetical protein